MDELVRLDRMRFFELSNYIPVYEKTQSRERDPVRPLPRLNMTT